MILAVAKEDKDLESHAWFYGHFQPQPRFRLLADLDHQTSRFRETSVYLIDKEGVVRDIFPGTVRTRPNWLAVLEAVKVVNGK